MGMNDDTIQDLKQFIATTVSQQTTELVVRLDKVDNRLDKVDSRLGKVEGKIDDLAVAVGEALDITNEVTDNQLKDYNRRITKLEQKAA